MDNHVSTPVIVAVDCDPASPGFSTAERRWLVLTDAATDTGRVVEERSMIAWPPVFIYSAVVRSNWWAYDGPVTANELLTNVTICDTDDEASRFLAAR